MPSAGCTTWRVRLWPRTMAGRDAAGVAADFGHLGILGEDRELAGLGVQLAGVGLGLGLRQGQARHVGPRLHRQDEVGVPDALQVGLAERVARRVIVRRRRRARRAARPRPSAIEASASSSSVSPRHHARIMQAPDLGSAHAQHLGQHLVGVLPKPRRRLHRRRARPAGSSPWRRARDSSRPLGWRTVWNSGLSL